MELLKALKGEKTEYTPVWFMRQAGRFLPEYREIRASVKDFFELCQNVELSVKATLLPVNILKVDAAILFSDLLVPLLPMRNLTVNLVENIGPVINCKKDIVYLDDVIEHYHVKEELSFVADIIKGVKEESEVPLIGFCGAPFTLISYVIEGGGSRNYHKTKKFMYLYKDTFRRAIFKLTGILKEFFLLQKEAGIDAFQIFDSWAGTLSPDDYQEFIFNPTKDLILSIENAGIPAIYFSTGTCGLFPIISEYPSTAVSVDWRQPLSYAVEKFKGKVIQGNLEPSAVFLDRETLSNRVRSIILDGLNAKSHIFNLGHGILPDTDPDTVKWLVDFVHGESRRLKERFTQKA